MVPFGLGRPRATVCTSVCTLTACHLQSRSLGVWRCCTIFKAFHVAVCAVYLDVALRHDFGFPRAALVLVARFLLQMNFMQRRGSMFLLFAVAALVITAQRTLAPQKRSEILLYPWYSTDLECLSIGYSPARPETCHANLVLCTPSFCVKGFALWQS